MISKASTVQYKLLLNVGGIKFGDIWLQSPNLVPCQYFQQYGMRIKIMVFPSIFYLWRVKGVSLAEAIIAC